MSFKEISSRLDEIVAFTEIEKFLDTPVKWYSSGMYAKLGFGVAAHSDPDVLLVDEVLAVGDTAFQRKAIDSMRGLVQAGKTVVLVSHDLGNVRGLCKQVLWLDKGEIRALGPTEEIVAQYLDDVNSRAMPSKALVTGPRLVAARETPASTGDGGAAGSDRTPDRRLPARRADPHPRRLSGPFDHWSARSSASRSARRTRA